MRKPFDFRFFAIVSFVTVLVVVFLCFNVHLPSSRPFLSKYLVSETASHQTGEFKPVQRKSLLIIGKGRSGTSFMSKMFGSGDRVSKQHNNENSSFNCSQVQLNLALQMQEMAKKEKARRALFIYYRVGMEMYFDTLKSIQVYPLKYLSGISYCQKKQS